MTSSRTLSRNGFLLRNYSHLESPNDHPGVGDFHLDDSKIKVRLSLVHVWTNECG